MPVRDQLGDLHKWKAKYGGLEVSDVKRLKELERGKFSFASVSLTGELTVSFQFRKNKPRSLCNIATHLLFEPSTI